MLVSILIPCFNCKRFIGQAIESALAQSWPNKEVIVVDDGSNDGSLDVIKYFGDRIRWETGPNCGGNAARNRLLTQAKGEWLQYLDADDYLLPEKISRQMESVDRYPGTDVLFGPVTVEHWSEIGARRELIVIPKPHDPWMLLANWGLPQTGAPLWRKQALTDVGGWKVGLPCCQEHDLYLRLLMASKRFTYADSGGAVYRQWGNHTVCKRDISETHRQRLRIKQTMEEYLSAKSLLGIERLDTINQARFTIARVAWRYDHEFAQEIILKVYESNPSFSPQPGSIRALYRLMFRCFGFQVAESIASAARSLVRDSVLDH